MDHLKYHPQINITLITIISGFSILLSGINYYSESKSGKKEKAYRLRKRNTFYNLFTNTINGTKSS